MDESVRGVCLLSHCEKKKAKKGCTVHPINGARHVDGAFRNLFGVLREDNEKTFHCMSMSMIPFDELVLKCQSAIEERQDLVLGVAFSTQEMLAITLR
ncbi:hypothetical protein PR048_006340 [Dryococelus australis]|uniref:Uncharacterized protein n=1 Tax=Dryococelus australis TaxID=614101 RepID=A0ABQ9IC14_9NEOP|nr:hypothetical protein PR048_006340 [Dryococelus australis]